MPEVRTRAREFGLQFCLVCALAVALGGCASGGMTNMWVDKTYVAGPPKSMLVVAVRQDPVRRRIWEDAFTEELNARGVAATPSYRIFPELPDTDQVIRAVQDKGYEGLLVSDRLETTTDAVYVPGYLTTEPVTRYNRWTGSYATNYRQVRTPGHTETIQVRSFETQLYSMRGDGSLVWAGTMETTDALDAAAVRRSVAKLILPEMAKAGLVGGTH